MERDSSILIIQEIVAATLVAFFASPALAAPRIAKTIDVAPVWSAHPVGFALLTRGRQQLVAFYDHERRMTIGSRPIDDDHWQFARLSSTVGWDSHNSVTMAVDSAGQIHVCGNMHCVPLIYFRTTRPMDITSFEKIPAMVGRNEKSCTYPRFLRGPRGELIFTYRDGRSGNGDQYFNVYDPRTQTWRRLIDGPLFAGEGQRNAYFVGPVQDRQGVFHVCWVWRQKPDCSTNHDLGYARSRDLVHWETSSGQPQKLPITLQTGEVVDPVPVGGGLLNGHTLLGFDPQDRPVIAYHKFDARGNTQAYNARRESAGWKIYQTSDWDYRWDPHGGGTIRVEVSVGPVLVSSDGSLTQSYHHVRHGSGVWRLDPATLKPLGILAVQKKVPKGFSRVESTWPGMEPRSAADLGQSDDPGVSYLLRWETLGANRDHSRPPPLPPPNMLRLVEVRERP